MSAIRLAEVFQEEGIDPRETTLKTLVIGAEPHTDEQRRKIERMLNLKEYNSFGMTEMPWDGDHERSCQKWLSKKNKN